MSKKKSLDITNSGARLPNCSLLRRLAVILYDGLLVLALWMVAAAAVVIPSGTEIQPGAIGFQLYLLIVAWAYFAISWRHGGQTLGMRAWHVRLIADQHPVAWSRTVTRFLIAIASWLCLGLGFLWSLFHAQRATWHDLVSGTQLVVEPKRAMPSEPAQHQNTQRADQQGRQ